MKKAIIFALLAVLLGQGVFAPSVFAGKVELTTYYPAPYGEYREVKTSQTLTIPTKPVGTPADPGAILNPGEIWVEGACQAGSWNAVSGRCE